MYKFTVPQSACKKEDALPASTGIRPRFEHSTLTATSNYFELFKDNTVNSNVDFSGQTIRQDMLAEMEPLHRSPL